MSSIYITGAEIVTPLETFKGNVRLEGEQISKVSDTASSKLSGGKHIDGHGCFLTPGLIDLQVNGSPSCNLWDHPDIKQFERLRAKLLSLGVTSFLPTLITDEIKALSKSIDFLADNGVKDSQDDLSASQGKRYSNHHGNRQNISKSLPKLSRVPGIHLEGPFLSAQKAGIHPAKWLRIITAKAVKELATPQVKLITIAAELKGAAPIIKLLRKQHVTVSLGHSNATFDQALSAFRTGVTLMTHTYNALPAFHHRAPGAVVAAMLDPKVFCTVIADGKHVHPAALELLLKCKGVKRTILVSDMATEGTRHGKLVGSSITVTDAVRNIVRWKIATFPEAILMATYNPALAIGLERKIGQIKPGQKADLLLWDKKSLQVKRVILDGQLIQ